MIFIIVQQIELFTWINVILLCAKFYFTIVLAPDDIFEGHRFRLKTEALTLSWGPEYFIALSVKYYQLRERNKNERCIIRPNAVANRVRD